MKAGLLQVSWCAWNPHVKVPIPNRDSPNMQRHLDVHDSCNSLHNTLDSLTLSFIFSCRWSNRGCKPWARAQQGCENLGDLSSKSAKMSCECHMSWSKGHPSQSYFYWPIEIWNFSNLERCWHIWPWVNQIWHKLLNLTSVSKSKGRGFELLTKHVLYVYITAWWSCRL